MKISKILNITSIDEIFTISNNKITLIDYSKGRPKKNKKIYVVAYIELVNKK